MKERNTISASVPGVPASGCSEAPNGSASEHNTSASGCSEAPIAAAAEFGGFSFGDFSELEPADPVPAAADFRLLTEGYRIGWALVKETRLLREQTFLLNSLLFGIAQQVWGVKLSLIRPLKYEKPRRRAAAKAADKPKAAKAPKAAKTKRTKEGKSNEQ